MHANASNLITTLFLPGRCELEVFNEEEGRAGAVAGEARWDRPELLSSANLSRYSPVFLPRDTRSPSAGFSPCQRQSASHSLGHTSVKQNPSHVGAAGSGPVPLGG